jgi:uncharacterized repeat protein (TIGR01451 family)
MRVKTLFAAGWSIPASRKVNCEISKRCVSLWMLYWSNPCLVSSSPGSLLFKRKESSMTTLLHHRRRGGMLCATSLLFLLTFSVSALAQNADLSIVKATDSPTAAAGTDVSFDISVSNFSGQPSTPDNIMTDTIPMGMTFVSETHPVGWSCMTPAVGGGGTITCTSTAEIPDESSVLFTFVFHIDANVPDGTMISNTASVSHEGSDPNSMNNSSTATVTVGSGGGGGGTPPGPREVLISEFRLSGPGGQSDEYIEFYCNRNTDCDISGYSIRSYDPNIPGDFSTTFPGQTIIPARQFLLIADLSQYSLPDYATPDFNVHNPDIPDFFVDNQGLQLVAAEEGTIIDSVGFIGGGNDTQYIEGTGLTPSGGITPQRPPDQYAYVRKRTLFTNGLPQDTNNNAEDFVLVSVTGAPHPGILVPPVLGAPGPKSLSSPKTYSNAQWLNSYVEPANDPHAPPNRVRTGSGNGGTLSIRRSITNNTNDAFDYVGFRVIEIPTLNSPNPGGRAQVRLVTSEDAETFENSQARTVVIRGTILEFDPNSDHVQPEQPLGGGLNSSAHANLIDTLILPGQTLDVQFLLNVDVAGDYRFFVYVEAFPAPLVGAPGELRRRVNTDPAKVKPVPRQMVNLKRGALAIGPSGKKPKPNPLMPTKSTSSGTTPAVVIMRINQPGYITPSSHKRPKRKLRVKRRSSAALRVRADARLRNETPAQ